MKHRHTGNNARIAEVGDIERLDPLRQGGQVERLLEPLERFHTALRGGRRAQNLLARVQCGAFCQTAPVAAFRNLNRHLVARLFRQKLLQRVGGFNLARQQDLPRPCAAVFIVLLQQIANGLGIRLKRFLHQLKILTGQVAVREVQHGEAASGPALEAHRVRVGIRSGNHALVVLQPLHGAQPVAQLGGVFKAQRLCRFFHAPRQIGSQLRRFALQNQLRLLNRTAIFRCGSILQAIARAGAQMVVQARPLAADVLREPPRAGWQLQRFFDGVNDLPRHRPPAERAEVPCAVLLHAVDERERGIFALHIQPDKGIALVVLEQDVIFGPVQLDERVFQHKRLKLGLHHNNVEIRYVRNHNCHLGQVLAAKITRDAVFQRFRLADVDHFPSAVEHQVNARQQRQHICFFPQLVEPELFHTRPPVRSFPLPASSGRKYTRASPLRSRSSRRSVQTRRAPHRRTGTPTAD